MDAMSDVNSYSLITCKILLRATSRCYESLAHEQHLLFEHLTC